MILIAGRGVAALVCAQRLAARGCLVTCYGPPPQDRPMVLLGQDTLDLLRSQFPTCDLNTLGHPIQGRDVLWGKEPLTQLSTPARAVSLSSLVEHLEPALSPLVTRLTDRPPTYSTAVWQIDATGRHAYLATEIAGARANLFGQRCMVTVPVELQQGRSDRVGMELIQSGWLFLCPTNPHTGVLQLMVPQRPPNPEQAIQLALSQSQLITERLASIAGPLQILPAAPQILEFLGSESWLAVGAAACSFDPVCGDGIGQAIRSALLASAVPLSPSGDILLTDALRHYHLRHRYTFAWHLHHIYTFYKPLLTQTAWFEELTKTRQFLYSHAAYNLLYRTHFAYQLRDLALEPRANAPQQFSF